MSFGGLFRGDALGTQLSANDPAYVQVAAGTRAIGGSAIALPGNITAPLIFVTSPAPVALRQVAFGDTVQLVLVSPLGATGTLTYKVFAPVANLAPSAETMGLRVWTGAGQLTYDNGRLPLALRYAGVATRNAGGFTLDHGVDGGLVCLNPFGPSKAVFTAGGLGGSTDYYSFAMQTAGSTLTASHVATGSFLGGADAADPYDGTTVPILVIAP